MWKYWQVSEKTASKNNFVVKPLVWLVFVVEEVISIFIYYKECFWAVVSNFQMNFAANQLSPNPVYVFGFWLPSKWYQYVTFNNYHYKHTTDDVRILENRRTKESSCERLWVTWEWFSTGKHLLASEWIDRVVEWSNGRTSWIFSCICNNI